ncbi:hypothetical protein AAG906_039087 [Vitis piasezkii]
MNSHRMSKASPTSVFLLWMFVIVFTMVGVVRGDPCIEGLGLCGHDCAQRCTKLHPGGEGSCEVTGNVPLCTCYYECPLPPPSPPKPKTCYGAGNPCTVQCWNDCCNQNCGVKYKNGTGYCDDIGVPPILCQCEYPC